MMRASGRSPKKLIGPCRSNPIWMSKGVGRAGERVEEQGHPGERGGDHGRDIRETGTAPSESPRPRKVWLSRSAAKRPMRRAHRRFRRRCRRPLPRGRSQKSRAVEHGQRSSNVKSSRLVRTLGAASAHLDRVGPPERPRRCPDGNSVSADSTSRYQRSSRMAALPIAECRSCSCGSRSVQRGSRSPTDRPSGMLSVRATPRIV